MCDVAYAELQPDNILLDGHLRRSKICDLGQAVHPTVKQESLSGTLPYLAPERVHGGSAPFDATVDTWSAALVIVEMILRGRRWELDVTDAQVRWARVVVSTRISIVLHRHTLTETFLAAAYLPSIKCRLSWKYCVDVLSGMLPIGLEVRLCVQVPIFRMITKTKKRNLKGLSLEAIASRRETCTLTLVSRLCLTHPDEQGSLDAENPHCGFT